MCSVLRPEIIAAQESRSRLFQHKLTVVAAIGAVGLGLDIGSKQDLKPLWVLIPWVCIYVDLLAHQLDTRILVIHHFLSAENRVRSKLKNNYLNWDEGDYEVFAGKTRRMPRPEPESDFMRPFGLGSTKMINAFRSEGDLVDLTTIVVTILSILGPLLAYGSDESNLHITQVFVISGVIAIVAKMWLMRMFTRVRRSLRNLEDQWFQRRSAAQKGDA